MAWVSAPNRWAADRPAHTGPEPTRLRRAAMRSRVLRSSGDSARAPRNTGCRTRRARRTDHSGGKELVRTKGWETGGGGGVGSKAGGLGPKAGGLGSKAGGLGSVAGQRTIAGHLCSAVNSGPSAARMGI